MGRTSIPCSTETRDLIKAKAHENESYDECLQRLAEGTPAPADTEHDDLSEVLDELAKIERLLERLDEGSTERGGATVNEIREAVRAEVQNEMKNFEQSLMR